MISHPSNRPANNKLSVWTKSKEDENGTVVPKLRGDEKIRKSPQWIRDKGRSED